MSKAWGHKDFWNTSKPCIVGIHWLALAEYSQMSTHVPGFQSFLGFQYHFVLDKSGTSSIRLTIPMLRVLLSKEQGIFFLKPSKPYLVGIHWIALAEYYQMSSHVPGFQSFFRVFVAFFIGKSGTSSIRLPEGTFFQGNRGSITSGWKEEESCTSEWFCVLGRGLPSR